MRGMVPITVLVLCSAAPPSAMAFRCSRVGAQHGPSLIWGSRQIDWWAAEELTRDLVDRAATLAAIQAGYAAWADVDCSDLELRYAGMQAGLRAEATKEGPNQNIIAFVPRGWPYDPLVIGVTTSAYDPETGVLYDADIELNDQHFLFTLAELGCNAEPGSMDLQNTVTHEVGHVIGLDHPPNSQQYEATTMFASAPPCEISKRTLEADDRLGICTIYPAGQPTQQCFLPEGPSFLVLSEDDGFGCRAVRARPRWDVSALGWVLLAVGLLLRWWRDSPEKA
ncbi:MAG: matrixin family metalloprotease [Deltaproteobacteria bacterium]|nr:matrixin family metalloprotease [Deltaproteobacteria bacterium]